jgi:hypothetical protein
MPPKHARTACENCHGRGYDLFQVDRDPGQEIERCDSCGKLKDDDAAAVQFARDLERGDTHAKYIAATLIEKEPDDASL